MAYRDAFVTLTRRGPWRPVAQIGAGGLATGALGLSLRALTSADPQLVAPGAVILLIGSALLAWVRWRWICVIGGLVALVGLLNVSDGGTSNPLEGGSGVVAAFGSWLLLVGAGTALVACVLAVVRGRAPRDVRRAPRSEPLEPAQESPWPRRLQIAALLVLAPVCAEYLAAYDNTTGDAVQLIGGLIIFSPLYGAPALLIREVSRRAGLGWVGIILLATAFGLMEAGVVDQSLFSLDYRHIESWDATLRGTFLAPLGLSAYNTLNFVGGHVIYSICAPIALVEAFRPSHAREPWLGRTGLAVVALLYAAASGFVLEDSLVYETSHASIYQVIGSVGVIGPLVLAAFLLRNRADTTVDRPAARVRTIFFGAVVVAVLYNLLPPTWTGFALSATAVAVGCVLLYRSARSPEWTMRHTVAVAAGFVLTRAVLSFTYFPVIGHISAARKYGHSIVFLVGMLAVCWLAMRQATRAADSEDAPADVTAHIR